MVADWTVAFGRFFRTSQIQPISLTVFIKIFFSCSPTENRSLLISTERTMFVPPGCRSLAAFQSINIEKRHAIDTIWIVLWMMGVVGVVVIKCRFQVGE